MIVSKLQGGLGNQLFQWATTYSLSLDYNTAYMFDLSYFLYRRRPFMLHNFPNISIPIVDKNYEVSRVTDDFNYKRIPDNSFLDGYWQSEKYFINYKKIIQNILSTTEIEKIKLLNKYPKLNGNTTSIHVRRGDYLQFPNTHPVLPISYYDEAIKVLKCENILVFSDDIAWCKENIKFDNCEFIDQEDEITTMKIMSLCKSNIIANSSFSWWGAWVSTEENKKVIAPKNWFGSEGPKNWNDIYCDSWIVI